MQTAIIGWVLRLHQALSQDPSTCTHTKSLQMGATAVPVFQARRLRDSRLLRMHSLQMVELGYKLKWVKIQSAIS